MSKLQEMAGFSIGRLSELFLSNYVHQIQSGREKKKTLQSKRKYLSTTLIILN